MKRAKRLSAIVLVSIVFGSFLFFEPTPTDMNKEHLAVLGATLLREQGIDGTGVVVAVIDTGVNYNHPYLRNNVPEKYKDYSRFDFCGHGTQVASALISIAPGVTLIPYRTSQPNEGDCGGSYRLIATSLYAAYEEGAQIAVITMGGPYNFSIVSQAVKDVTDKGMVVIASAGNTGQATTWFPGYYPESTTVGNILNNKSISPSSTYGPQIDFVAPGVWVQVAQWDPIAQEEKYGWMTGTSASAPIFAGASALVAQINETKDFSQLYEELKEISVDLGEPGRDDYYGHGLLDLSKKVEIPVEPPDELTRIFMPFVERN